MLALDIADEGQYGVFKILVTDPARAKQVLSDANIAVALTRVAVIEIADQPGSLVKLATAMDKSGLNVSDAYGCILERGKRAVFVVKGENVESIEAAARGAGLRVLDTLE